MKHNIKYEDERKQIKPNLPNRIYPNKAIEPNLPNHKIKLIRNYILFTGTNS